MSDVPARRPVPEALLRETALRLRPVFPELSEAAFEAVVSRIVAARLKGPTDAAPPASRPPSTLRKGLAGFRNRR